MSDIRYCRLCKKDETQDECAYGPSFWSKYSVQNLSKSVMDAAAKQSGIVSDKKEKKKVKKEEVEIAEAPKYDKKGLDKFDRSKRMIRHKQDKYGVATLKQSIMTGADHNTDNEKKAKTKKEESEGKTYNQFIEGASWTKKSGKNSEGGLNEKGRKSYEAENPGSDLKAPSKKVGNPRRASFCARMKGMRKRQKASNNTGDDRLSKSLRKWNC